MYNINNTFIVNREILTRNGWTSSPIDRQWLSGLYISLFLFNCFIHTSLCTNNSAMLPADFGSKSLPNSNTTPGNKYYIICINKKLICTRYFASVIIFIVFIFTIAVANNLSNENPTPAEISGIQITVWFNTSNLSHIIY